MHLVQSPNRQLQRTVKRHRGDDASASFHCALAPSKRQRAAANALARGTIENAFVEPRKVIDPLIEKRHIKKWPGDDAMKAAWDKFLSGEKEAAIDGAVKRGIDRAVATRVIESHLAALEKWKKIGEEVGTDGDKLAEKMWDEVYSKVKF